MESHTPTKEAYTTEVFPSEKALLIILLFGSKNLVQLPEFNQDQDKHSLGLASLCINIWECFSRRSMNRISGDIHLDYKQYHY